jgi:hypothetical protein
VTDVLDRPAGADDGDAGGVRGGADAFGVLGLPYSPDLTDEDVRRAYLARLRAVHPDAGGDQSAAAVTAAYSAVRSGVRRGELLAAAMTDRGDPPPGPLPGRPRRRPGTGGVPDAGRRAELRARVAASRRAQGLPPFITDPATLAKIADLMVAMEPSADARTRREPRPAGAAWRPAAGAPPARVSSWRSAGRRRFMRDYEAAEARAVAAVVAAGPSWWRCGWARVRYGRPAWLAARVILAGAVIAIAELAAPGDPAIPALGVGAATWLLLTGRLDLAPRLRR